MKLTDFPEINYQKLVDTDFYAKSFAEYLDARNRDYSALTALIQEAYDGEEGFPASIPSRLEELGLNHKSLIPTDTGYVGIYSLLAYTWDYAQAELNGTVDTFTPELHMLDATGQDTGRISSLEDIASSIVGQLTASIATSSAIKATLGSTRDIASKLMCFEQDASSAMSVDAASNLTTSVSYMRSLISEGAGPADIIASVYNDDAINTLASDQADSWNGDLTNSMAYEYMGASPAGPLCFDNVSNAVQAVGKVGATIAKGIFSAVSGLVSKGLSKVTQAVKEIVSDPDDLEDLKTDTTDNVIAEFCYNQCSIGSLYSGIPLEGLHEAIDPQYLPEGYYQVATGDDATLDRICKEFYQPYLNAAYADLMKKEFIQINFLFACVIMESGAFPRPTVRAEFVDGVQPVLFIESSDDGQSSPFYGKYKVLPRICNWSQINTYFPKGKAMNYEEIQAAVSSMANSGSALDTVNMTEPEKAGALRWALWMCEITNRMISHGAYTAELVSVPNFMATTTVSNKDFVFLAGGYSIDDQFNVSRDMTSAIISNVSVGNVGWLAFTSFFGLMWQTLERQITPTEYGFVSYIQSSVSTPQARYRIKKDSENVAAFNAFGTTLVLLVAAIVVAVTVGVVAKKVTRALAKKREKILATTQSKLWAGEELTPSEWRKYRKATKKGGISSLFQTASPGGSGGNQFSFGGDNSDIIPLIRGPLN